MIRFYVGRRTVVIIEAIRQHVAAARELKSKVLEEVLEQGMIYGVIPDRDLRAPNRFIVARLLSRDYTWYMETTVSKLPVPSMDTSVQPLTLTT